MHLQHRGGGRGVRVRRAQASRLFDLPLNIKVDAEFCNIEVDAEFFNIEVVDEFFNIEVVDEVFVFAALRHPGFSFDLPLNIKVDAEFYNIEVVD